ncbi:MAG: T9SS type A sorting domain-containing protein, partial [Dyadobacter sp.]
ALNNGNYVVGSQAWNNGSIIQVGAVTLLDGSKEFTGIVSNGNSLTGSHAGDMIGASGITPLSSGNFVISSLNWDNQEIVDAGAVTWVNGKEMTAGVISIDNSLIGTAPYDQIGNLGIVSIADGNYVVRSTNWNDGTLNSVGAVTWGNGLTGVKGVVNSSNSLVGTYANNRVGMGLINALPYGYYAVVNARAFTFASSSTGVSGKITECNSVLGLVQNGGIGMNSFYNSVYGYNIISEPSSNSVSIFKSSDLLLAESHEEASLNISGLASVSIKANTDCRIITTINPNGSNPVNGFINAKIWNEPDVVVYAGQPYVARHYQITPFNNPLLSTGRVTLYFMQQEFDDFNQNNLSVINLPTNSSDNQGKSNLRITKFNGTSNSETGLPDSYVNGSVAIDPADDDIVWNSNQNRWEISFDVTGFSGFFIQTNANPLPIKLVSFEAGLIENTSILKWKVADAENFSHFEVEKSLDGKSFNKIGNVKFSNSVFSYQLNDVNPFQFLNRDNVVYYRLKMNDLDGTFAYSRTLSIKNNNVSNDSRLYVYPNPFSGKISVNFKNPEGQKAFVTLINFNGDKVFSEDVIVSKDKIELNTASDHLHDGMYFLLIETDSGRYSVKVVRQSN